MQGADCLGFVGFDAVQTERIWRDEEVALLRVLAELYAHFEARRATEREMLELQKRLTQARDVAQAAALAKSLFLANMSHEIRTPLNAILGYAQIMERDCRICPTGLRLNAITRSGEHLLALITDLLELVRSDASVIPLVPGNFDFYQMLEDVRLMFVRQPDVQGLNLEVAYTPEVPHFIYADQGKVRQVLINLLGNAIKFTEKGAVRLSASVLADGRTEGITIAVDVEDTGCGIREDEQERIFDIFGQAEQGRKSGKGTGLGLPLSRRYARALGGDVTVSSRPGAGSIFRFVFHALAASSSETGLPLCGNVLRLAGDQIACRMLVVDDDQASREMLADMLTSVGFKVEMAASAAQALQRLRQADGIDLVLMDKSMPEMDGYEAIGRIRNLPEGRKLKVLAVTAAGFSDERAQALAAGADGYISKPVRREQLLEEIGRIAAVRYEYEQPQLATLTATHVAGLYPEKLKQLPVAQRQSMDQALRLGDIQQLRKLVETIALEHAGIAAGIGVLVDAYDYDRLQRLLDSAKETTT